VLVLALAGCSADGALFRADWNWWRSGAPTPAAMRAAGPEALVASDGTCPAEPERAPRAIALGMTECDLVRLAGPTDKIEIGASAQGERTAVLTYPQGERAGVYRFTSGLLVSIEQIAEPAKPQKPSRSPRARRGS